MTRYPPPRCWISSALFPGTGRHKPPEYRIHKWSRDEEYDDGWYCVECEAWISDEFFSLQPICSEPSESALDLVWYFYAAHDTRLAHKCPVE